MEVYADVVMLLNFLVDLCLLLGANRLTGYPAAPGRCCAAAVLGGVYGGLVLLPGFRFLGNLLWRTVFLGLMGMIAFGLGRDAGKRIGVFLILTMALGGLAVSVGRNAWLSLSLGGLGLWLLCRIGFGGMGSGQQLIPLELTRQGRTLHLTALRDTGNTLRDPVTGERVLVIAPEAACALTGLTVQALREPLDNLGKLPGLRLIPYRAVGTGGFLLGLRFENARIGGKRQSVIAAFAPEGLGMGDGFQALAGGIV